MKQFALFFAAGGFAAFLNWASRFLFSYWLPFEGAVTAAYMVGMVSAFFLMRIYVFAAKDARVVPQAGMFVLVNVFALAQTLIVSVFMLRVVLPWAGVTNHLESVAHLAGVLFPAISSFVGHKYLTFR